MKTKFNLIKSMPMILVFLLVFIACNSSKNDASKIESGYEIAPVQYSVLAEKSLDFLSSFEFDSFASMLADNVAYEFPDGEKISGKTALINYWKNYKITSSIASMKIINANYLPINTPINLKNNEDAGVKVLADFTNIMIIKGKETSIKMNFSIHFNKEKLIDRVDTFYDSSKLKAVH